MKDKVKIFCLGGLDEVGRNMTVVEINDDIFVLDCGLQFPDKTAPGVDCILPNFNYIIENRSRLKAYLLSHGHDQSLGALPYFYDQAPAPIYCSLTSAAILQVLANDAELNCAFDLHLVKPTSSNTIAGREVRFFQTSHNISCSSGIAIRTDKGWIVYSSDFIADFDTSDDAFKFDLPALSKISEEPTLILLSESRGASKPGYCAPTHRITHQIEREFTDNTGRIFGAVFSMNVFNLKEMITLALQNHKKIVLYDDKTKRIINILLKLGVIKIGPNILIEKENAGRVREQDLLILISHIGQSLYDTLGDLATGNIPDQRFAIKATDSVVIAAPPSDQLEQIFTKTIDTLFKTQARIKYLTKKNVASMHARQDDLKLLLSLLKPKYYMPVRGSYSDMIENAKLALGMNVGLTHFDIFVLDNGNAITIDGNGNAIPDIDTKIDVREIVVDGLGVGDVIGTVLEERKELGSNGLIVLSVVISTKLKKIISNVDVQTRGFVNPKESEPFAKMATSIFLEEISNNLQNSSFNTVEIKEIIEDRVRKSLRHTTKRNPKVISIIIDQDKTL